MLDVTSFPQFAVFGGLNVRVVRKVRDFRVRSYIPQKLGGGTVKDICVVDRLFRMHSHRHLIERFGAGDVTSLRL